MRFHEIYTSLMEEKVNSSWISEMEFHNGTAFIKLQNGYMYAIHGMAKVTYNMWKKSPSKGKYWHNNIKDVYDMERMT